MDLYARQYSSDDMQFARSLPEQPKSLTDHFESIPSLFYISQFPPKP